MLRWRLLLGFMIIAALIGLCWLDQRASIPGIYLLPVGLLLVVLASSEVISMLEAGGLKPRKGIIYVGNSLLFTSCWLPMVLKYVGKSFLFARNWPPMLVMQTDLASEGLTLILFAMCILAVFIGEMLRYEKPGGNLANAAASVFALSYVGLMFYFLAQLRMNWGVGAMASMIIVVKMGDTGAYTVGRIFGRHKMAPRLSPGKTIEGAIGAIIFSCIGAWLYFHVLGLILVSNSWKTILSIHWNSILSIHWNSILNIHVGLWFYGIFLGIAGIFGDLAESFIKRDVGRKDSSTWMPGFGGVLDILDSLLLAAPVAWLCWILGIR
jgi:phosphatidate cytidylyltransferase